VAAVFASLQLVLLVLQVRLLGRGRGLSVSVAAAVVNLVASLHILALSWAEDARSVRPSSLITVYLLLSLVFDVPQARTRWLLGTHSSLAAVFTASIGAKVVLLALECINKRRYLQSEYRSLPPESTSGILNRSLLWWLNDLFNRGYRTLLPFDALYVLDRELTSDALGEKIARAWAQRRVPERRFEYPLVVCRALWWPILQIIIPRLFLVGFTFAQPFLITSALDLLIQPHNQVTRDQGYGLIGATALVYVGLAVSTLLFEHCLYRAITMFRGATVLLIHQHTLEIRDGAYDASAAITLMSTDTDSVIKATERVNEVWARAIEVAVGIYLLARQLGWPCVVPLVAVLGKRDRSELTGVRVTNLSSLVSSGISSFLSKRIGGNQKKWVNAVQKRIALTSSILSGIKSIKMMGLSRVLTSLIQEARIVETNLMSSFRQNIVWMNVAANIPEIWAPTLTFAVYAAQASAQGSASIGTTQAFTSLAVIGLMARPAGILVSSIVSVAASTGCFDRIQQFLVSPCLKDQRLRIYNDPSIPGSSAPDSSDVELQIIRPNASRKQPDAVPVLVEDANIRPAASADVLLRDVRFGVFQNSVTMILGPVGSGKTTLLKAILGELPCDTGSIRVSSSRIAYCAQTSWLPNTTIRQAICGPAGGQQTDEQWYESTVKACGLNNDFSLLPEGDLTAIGTGSTVLSGGQKQRVALARAVYHRPDLALLDDVLSALDSQTKHHVVENLLCSEGLFRKLGTAVVLVTHDGRTEVPLWLEHSLTLRSGLSPLR
jgi:ATP-binding cassette subfamily C (CFTR/MRP) protein 1